MSDNPYATPAAEVEGPAAEVDYAGFWVRAGASILDTILFTVIVIPLLLAIYGTGYYTESSTELMQGPADRLINYVLPLVLTVWLWTRFGATPGKMALRLKVIDAATGEPPGVGRSVGRYFAYLVSTLPLFLGFLWVGWDKQKRGFHDMLAGTRVVRRP